LLTDDQSTQRQLFARILIEKFARLSSKSVSEVVNGVGAWTYQNYPENNQQSTLWIFGVENPPTKVVRSQSAGTQMLTVLFRRSGPVTAITLLEQCTVTTQWYCEVALPSVLQKLEDSQPGTGLRGIMLHLTMRLTRQWLRQLSFCPSQVFNCCRTLRILQI
jgi:hypothetical protein